MESWWRIWGRGLPPDFNVWFWKETNLAGNEAPAPGNTLLKIQSPAQADVDQLNLYTASEKLVYFISQARATSELLQPAGKNQIVKHKKLTRTFAIFKSLLHLTSSTITLQKLCN
jgi:hypothetical protein